MMHRCRASALLIFLLLLLGSGTVSAQYFDPAAEQHAWSLFRAYDSSDYQTYTQLLNSDPVLSRKAFIFVLNFYGDALETDPESADEAADFAIELAAGIQNSFGDSAPS